MYKSGFWRLLKCAGTLFTQLPAPPHPLHIASTSCPLPTPHQRFTPVFCLPSPRHPCVTCHPGRVPVTLIPGDGVGPEIMDSAQEVLQAMGAKVSHICLDRCSSYQKVTFCSDHFSIKTHQVAFRVSSYSLSFQASSYLFLSISRWILRRFTSLR